MDKKYEAFVSLPNGRDASNRKPKLRWVVAASFQFGDPSKYSPQWMALRWCKSMNEAQEAVRVVNRTRRRYPVIEAKIIPVKHRLYQS